MIVPRIQIATIAQTMALHDRAMRFPARGDAGFKREAKQGDSGRQKPLDL